MLKLHVLANTELSEYCLNILEKHGIVYLREFILEKTEKLMKILNLNFEQVLTIKKEFRRIYGPKVKTFEERLAEEKRKRKVYGCQISCLDDMLMPSDVLNNLSFWEICGPTGVGKTQLLLTLVLNFVVNQISPVLYIDTKLDFSARRIKQMLKARKLEQELHAGIMSYIRVERVLSAKGVVEMLEQFLEQLQQENEDVMAIKLIVIDSLPAVWFLLKAESDRLAGKWLLSRLCQVINRLVFEHYIAVICVNLSLIPPQEENETKETTTRVLQLPHNDDHDVSDLIEADDMVTDNKPASLLLNHRPVLGHFWLTKPHLRLSLEYAQPEDGNHSQDNASSLRIIRILKSRFSSKNVYCTVRVQDEGVVDAAEVL